VDFVVSDDENTYCSYLIRSAVINDELIEGPNKVYNKILEESKLSFEELENVQVKIVADNSSDIVLFSERINLGKNAGEYQSYKLRAVLCDKFYRGSKYPAKEKMIVDFLCEKVGMKKMGKKEAMDFAKEKLGYIPSAIKNLK